MVFGAKITRAGPPAAGKAGTTITLPSSKVRVPRSTFSTGSGPSPGIGLAVRHTLAGLPAGGVRRRDGHGGQRCDVAQLAIAGLGEGLGVGTADDHARPAPA